jgi:hypothetical protein
MAARRLLMIAALFAPLGALLTGFSPVPRPAPAPAVTPVKLGFDYMTPEQVVDLWRRADHYALAEAFLKHCGHPPNIERRMHQAARDCIEPRALHKVAVYFRSKVMEMGRKHNFVCDTPEAKKVIKNARAKIDRDVEEVRAMCRACFIC